jgi:hypothetical protein
LHKNIMKRYLPKHSTLLPILGFAVLTIVLFVFNYTPGTYLTGWDNLHPEFNYELNIKRQFFSVWQEYQGLGLLAGMGHASDLFREIFLWLVSFIIPASFIRYFYHFLMLFVGMTGVFFLLKNILLADKTDSIRTKGALLGALFYLFNLGTIQYFYVPFEPYSTTWGFFPWGIYTLLAYLQHQDKKHLWMLILVNFLAVAQGYVQTIFLVYVICISIILALHWFRARTKQTILLSLKILGIIFIVNAFWLVPNLYFVVSDLSVTREAMQNRMATEKFFQMNKNRGTVVDYPVLREFYFDFYDYNLTTNEFDFLMKPWRDHYASPIVLILGYSFFGVILLGLIQKSRYRIYLVGLFILCTIIFLSDTFLISTLNLLFRSIPVVNQIFRNPFTKFIVPTVFVFALCFGIGTTALLHFIHKKTDSHKASFGVLIIMILLLLVTTFPVFQGKLIAPQMRVKIPDDYFQLFAFMQTQDKNARVMNLPQGDIWGWYHYEWGLRGSGFLWYGIEQPIMDRAFDVWSAPLENYYWEVSYALNKRDQQLFNNILEKYHVQYIIFDDSLLFSDNRYSIKPNLNQEKMLEANDKVQQVTQFGSVRVYKTTLSAKPSQHVVAVDRLPQATTLERFSNFDPYFKALNHYHVDTHEDTSSLIFPFGSLFTNRFQEELNFKLTENNETTTFSTTMPAGNYNLTLPSFYDTEKIIPVELHAKKEGTQLILQFELISPKITVDKNVISAPQKTVEVTIPISETAKSFVVNINNKDYIELNNVTSSYTLYGKTYLINDAFANYYRVYSQENTIIRGFTTQEFKSPYSCGAFKKDPLIDWTRDLNTISLIAKNAAICSPYSTTFSLDQNALIKASFEYKSSFDEFPQYCLFSENEKACLNKKDILRTGFAQNKSTYSEFFESSDFGGDIVSLQLILDALNDEDKNSRKEISYENVRLTSYPYIVGSVIDLSSINDSSINISVDVKKPTQLHVEFPIIQSSYSYLNPVKNNLYKKTPLNYDRLTSGEYFLHEESSSNKYLRTGAENASSYLLFRASDLPTRNGYLARVETRNTSNFPYIVNIFTNTEFRSYVYTYASTEKDFTKNYYVLPPYYEFDTGIDILLGSSSYNNVPTINDVADILIYPIPYDYLTGIRKEPSQITITPLARSLKAHKKDLSMYTVSELSDPNSTIVLSQAYHKGWNAYITPQGSLQTALPFLFGKKVTNHTKVNNWANGWILEDPISDKNHLVMVFVPQYLQYIGFFGFGALLLWLTLRYKERKVSEEKEMVQEEEKHYVETHELAEEPIQSEGHKKK